MKRTITVTQETIDKAVRNDSTSCAVAVAIKETIPDATHISVDLHTIRLTMRNGNRWAYVPPQRVADYIVAFDAGDTLHPFAFVLDDTKRYPIKRQKHTPKGAVVHTAKNNRTTLVKRLAELEADPDATEAQVQVAREKVDAADRRVAETTAALRDSGDQVRITDAPHDEETGPARKDPPRVFLKSQRRYGQRVLRVNNDPGPGDYRGPLDLQ